MFYKPFNFLLMNPFRSDGKWGDVVELCVSLQLKKVLDFAQVCKCSFQKQLCIITCES